MYYICDNFIFVNVRAWTYSPVYMCMMSRVKLICEKCDMSFLKYIFADSYPQDIKNTFTKESDVQCDSLRLLLGNNKPQNIILHN